MKKVDPMIPGMQIPVSDARFYLGRFPMTGQQIGPPGGTLSNFCRSFSYHAPSDSATSRGHRIGLPTKRQRMRRFRSRGVIAEARLIRWAQSQSMLVLGGEGGLQSRYPWGCVGISGSRCDDFLE